MTRLRSRTLHGLGETPTQAIVPAVAAFVAALNGEAAPASRHVKQARALLAKLVEMSPWYQAETRIVIARALARLDDVAGARAQLADAARDLRQTPDAPKLREWVQKAWSEADSASASGRWPLSPAELRLLHFLPTHLSFREIADELFVSPNTVKTQARSVYQKLGVSSRAEAVACARTAGLLQSDDSEPVNHANSRRDDDQTERRPPPGAALRQPVPARGRARQRAARGRRCRRSRRCG